MLRIPPNDYSTNFHLSPYYDCSNPFLPKKDPDLPLTNTESKFLELYLPFAQGMKSLYKSKTRLWDIETEVMKHADQVVEFLNKNPFRSRDVTNELIRFLKKTNDSLTLGKWIGREGPKTPVIKPLPLHLIQQSDSSDQKTNVIANAFFHASRA